MLCAGDYVCAFNEGRSERCYGSGLVGVKGWRTLVMPTMVKDLGEVRGLRPQMAMVWPDLLASIRT